MINLNDKQNLEVYGLLLQNNEQTFLDFTGSQLNISVSKMNKK